MREYLCPKKLKAVTQNVLRVGVVLRVGRVVRVGLVGAGAGLVWADIARAGLVGVGFVSDFLKLAVETGPPRDTHQPTSYRQQLRQNFVHLNEVNLHVCESCLDRELGFLCFQVHSMKIE